MNDSNCMREFKLRGLIEIYSESAPDVVKKDIKTLTFSEETFLGKLNSIFSDQEEPYCYGYPPENDPKNEFCRECPVHESCWIGYKDSHDLLNLTDRLSPDDVVSQLFEKCKQILPNDVKSKISFLQYKANRNKFQYMAVKHTELNPDGKKKIKGNKAKDKHVKAWYERVCNDPRDISNLSGNRGCYRGRL